MKITTKKLTQALLILTLTPVFQLVAQTPYINNIDITSSEFGQTVTINGSNFSSNAADLIVRFGAAEGTITLATANLLEVTVPAGATYDNISVTNTSGSTVKTGYSNEQFNLGFGGTSGSIAAFSAQELINESALDIDVYDLCLCDFDRNGLTDIAVANNGSNDIVIHENNSTSTTTNFTRSVLSPGFSTINTTCGDLDGDGWQDLVVTQGGSNNETIFIYRNLASGSMDFSSQITLTLPRNGSNLRFVRRVAIQDLDLDGKPDLVVTNTSDNVIDVFKNNSSQGAISMSSTSQQFTVEASDDRVAGLAGLDVKDLNNDGLPEIITIFNRLPDVFILRNSSEPGSISFEDSQEISANGGFQNLKVGDLNQDGFNDIALTGGTAGTPANTVVLIENQTATTGGAIQMSSHSTITGITAPWGLDLGDVDGDGSTDIVVASVGGTGTLFVLLATDPANFNFTSTSISTTENSRNIKIGDLNGDGKPDLAFTHDVSTGSPGELSIMMNRNCIVPVIDPAEDFEVCTGQTFNLKTTKSPSATYDWKRNGISVGTASELLVDTSSPRVDTYTVTVSDEGCTQTSEPVGVTVESASIAAPNASSSIGTSVVCAGTSVDLMTGQTFTGYEWSGPNGFSSTEQNPSIAAITQEQSGKYSVFGRDADGCISETSEVIVAVENLPVISVNNENEDVFCTGSTAVVTVTNFGTDYSYQWKKDGTEISGQTSTSLNVTESGDYSAVIVSTNSCEFESQPRVLTTVAVPTNSIVTDPVSGLICEDLAISFDAPAGDQNGHPVTHTWDFGDASATENGESVSHTYTDPSTPAVTLTTIYTNLANCPSAVTTANVTVQGVPNTTNGSTISITTGTGDLEKCPSDVLPLSLTDSYANYSWSSDLEPGTEYSTTSTMEASRPVKGDGNVIYTVSATDAALCDFTATAEISLKTALGISIETLETTTVNMNGETEINLEEDQLTVDLSVTNATNITWTPEEIFDAPTSEMVTAIPNDIDILVKVFGTDPGGCLESDSIRIINPIVRAKNVFSPNGDGIGDECWEITNARSKLDGCTIFIFDSKGQIIKQEPINSASQVDDCVWDGTHNGLLLPEGIYYYALKCVNNANVTANLSGSILLGR